MERQKRTSNGSPRSVPWPAEGEIDAVIVDTTWGEIQRLEAAPGVRTVAELELGELVERGAAVVDCRTRGSFGGKTIPGSVLLPHDEILARAGELDPGRVSILFCNGPQCPQSPDALRQLIDDGYPPDALAYYRGGMHDWLTLAMPTQPREDCPSEESAQGRARVSGDQDEHGQGGGEFLANERVGVTRRKPTVRSAGLTGDRSSSAASRCPFVEGARGRGTASCLVSPSSARAHESPPRGSGDGLEAQ